MQHSPLGGTRLGGLRDETDFYNGRSDHDPVKGAGWTGQQDRRAPGLPAMNRLAAILPASNVLVNVDATSKKRAFEQAGLLFENQHAIARSTVTDNLFARERLGSTGLGHAATQRHLEILSEIAEMLSDRELRERLKTEGNASTLHKLISEWQPLKSVA
jgi:PTS system nitrogen regulatory IIA component